MSTNKKLVFKVDDNDYVQNYNIKESKQDIGGNNEFVKYIYTADNSNRVTSVVYSNKLITEESKVKINEVMFKSVKRVDFNGIQYNSISVYYTKGKVALLVEFEKSSGKDWFVRKDDVGIYWAHKNSGYEESSNLEKKLRQIELDSKDKISYLLDKNSNYSDYVEILNDGNFHTEFAEYIYKPKGRTFKTSLFLYKGAPLQSMKSDELQEITEIQQRTYESVTVYFGTKFKFDNNFPPLIVKLTESRGNSIEYYVNKTYNLKSYWDKIDDLFTLNENERLISQLKKAQFNLFQSVVILIDIQKTDKYDDTLFAQTIEKNKINVVRGKKVNVKNIKSINFSKSLRFNVFQHDISNSVLTLDHVSETNLGLRFFFNNSNNGSGIRLYDKNTEYANEEYIYYEKVKKNLCVFFYESDPRPLLFYYNGQAFKPHSLKDYSTKWVKAENIKNFTPDSTDNNKLLDTLSEVTYIINPVLINKVIQDEEINYYITHTFYNDKKIDVKINVSCLNIGNYKCYTHEPANSNYVLGEVTHNNNKLFNNYDAYKKGISQEHKNKFPQKVSAYYHINDSFHKYPLLVVLKYENNNGGSIVNNTSDYFKLTKNTEPMEWKRIQNNSTEGILDESDREFLSHIQKSDMDMDRPLTQNYIQNETKDAIENKLENIIEKLSIDYTKIGKYPNIPPSGNLNDDSSSGAVAGTITTLSLAGAGGGFLFYKYQAIVMSFIRSLFH